MHPFAGCFGETALPVKSLGLFFSFGSRGRSPSISTPRFCAGVNPAFRRFTLDPGSSRFAYCSSVRGFPETLSASERA